jgi:hypothetical protein
MVLNRPFLSKLSRAFSTSRPSTVFRSALWIASVLDGLAKIQMLVPVQAVAIGCHHHICRGETEGRDDLFKLTLKSLSIFYAELRVRLEGGRITPLTRARVALKRIVRRMGI